jgi:hypothetical protein
MGVPSDLKNQLSSDETIRKKALQNNYS